MALCWLNSALEARPKGSATWQLVGAFGEEERTAFASLMNESSEWKFRKALRPGFQEEMNVSGGNIRRSSNAPFLHAYGTGLAFDFATLTYPDSSDKSTPVFVKLRGEAVHTHLYIPKHVAKAALELVCAAVHEFETEWLEYFHPGTLNQATSRLVEAPSWPRLCEVCQLDFLPPKLRD